MIRNSLLTVGCCVALLPFAGCRTSQQSSIPNPFLTADRVPPVPTRIPSQGTAQPYYPGDAMPPLPASGPAMQPLGALAPSPDITPIGSGSLGSTAQSTSNSIASAEPAMRIPSDNSSMRFTDYSPQLQVETPVPAAQSQVVTPQVAMAQVAVANNTPDALAARQPSVTPTPTVYTPARVAMQPAPVVNNWPPVAAPQQQSPAVSMTPVGNHFTDTNDFSSGASGARSGLFREPSVPSQAPSLVQPASSPRIRLPNAGSRIEQQVVTPGTINTTSYQVGMAGGGQVQQAVLPPPGYVPHSLSQPASFGGSSFDNPQLSPLLPSDGFRARGSARRSFDSGSQSTSIPRLSVTPG